jgi:glyoxylase-like metal-dependent hydrolase (beta-lactamase superfamily II)
MEFIKIFEDHYYFKAAVNIGYVHLSQKGKGILIDAGLDPQNMKKVIKKLDEEKLPITHLFITHSHADHYGGAAYIQSKKDVFTLAPYLEEAVLRNPVLASLSFFQANYPVDELRNKFIEGQALHIDQIVSEGSYEIDGFYLEFISLPGHSINQLGLKTNDLLYAADSYFGKESLEKHKIPYIIDLDRTLLSLDKVNSLQCRGAIPGHGIYEEDFQTTVNLNKTKHLEILQSMKGILNQYVNGISHEQLIQLMCNEWGIELTNMTTWALYRTAITSYVTKLNKDQEVSFEIENNTLMIKLKKKEKPSI